MRSEIDFTKVAPGESVINLTDPKIKRAIEDAAASFGLTNSSRVSRDTYDGLIVLGGVGLAPLLRLKYALDQIGPNGNPVKFNWIALLGCDRIVSKEEHERVESYAPTAKTEFELMIAAAEKLLQLTLKRDATMRKVGYPYDRKTQPHVRYFSDAQGTIVLAFNAPIPKGDVKANTSHTYDFLRAASGPRLGKGKHVLLASASLYSAFQHIDAERILSLTTGISIETIGYDRSYTINGIITKPPLPPKELLQEIKSYIDALAKLKKATALGRRHRGTSAQLK